MKTGVKSTPVFLFTFLFLSDCGKIFETTTLRNITEVSAWQQEPL